MSDGFTLPCNICRKPHSSGVVLVYDANGYLRVADVSTTLLPDGTLWICIVCAGTLLAKYANDSIEADWRGSSWHRDRMFIRRMAADSEEHG